MEEVNEFKHLGSVICKHGGMEGEIRERPLQGGRVAGSLGRIMNGRSVSMDEVKRDLRNTIIVPTLTHASETWAWNESQRYRQAVEMSYLRSAYGVSRMDGKCNESVYERFGMCHWGEGKKCEVMEEVKRQTLKWFGHMERMEESKITRRVHVR